MTDENDERAAAFPEYPASGLDQSGADPLPLPLRNHTHGTQGRSGHVADGRGTVKDVPDDLSVRYCDEREENGAVRPECVDDVGLQVLVEGAREDAADRGGVARTLPANFDHGAGACPGISGGIPPAARARATPRRQARHQPARMTKRPAGIGQARRSPQPAHAMARPPKRRALTSADSPGAIARARGPFRTASRLRSNRPERIGA
jgi:hypothetical protein